MIGVVGEGDRAGEVAERLLEAGATVEHDTATAVLEIEPEAVVAADESALVDLVAMDVDVPVAVLGAGFGTTGIDAARLGLAVDALVDGAFAVRDHRLVDVEAAGEPVGRAALDVMLVRSEPGRISEFGVRSGRTRSRFRADGVVAATPLGSHGYARAAGGPRLAPDVGGVAIVPVAAFGLGTPNWVVEPDGGVRLSVERDEGDVSLLVDGRERRRLTGRAAVELAPQSVLRTVDLGDG